MPTPTAPSAVEKRPLPRDNQRHSTDDFSEAGGAVYRAVRGVLDRESGRAFLLRRVANEVEEPGTATTDEGAHLSTVVSALFRFVDDREERSPDAEIDLSNALLSWAAHLECYDRMSGASRLLEAALELRPANSELTLHAARVARKNGRTDRACSLYCAVRDLETGRGRLSRMARVGLALVDADDPEAALGRALRGAVRSGDAEAAAVAHEERARIRREARDRAGALRDYGAATVRFEDPADRGRVIHAAADLLMAAGEVLAARDVLLEMEHLGRSSQTVHAHARLRGISRTLGDELGLRRWKDETGGGLVFLSSPRGAPPARSLRSTVSRALRRLSALAGNARNA